MTLPAHVAALSRAIARKEAPRLLSVPGCWDGFSALLVEQAGFAAAFLTGSGLAMARLGRPDLGLVTATELEETVWAIRDRIELPLLVDADTGFGGTLNAARTVRRLERAGASAIQIEDQTFPKRCGQMEGKSLAPVDEALARLHAALDARVHALVIARTDAIAVEGLGPALERAQAYMEAGADLVFLEGPRTNEELTAVARRFATQVPLVHNLVEGGVSPTTSGAVLEELGFAIALHPLVLLHAFARIAPSVLDDLRGLGTTAPMQDRLVTLQEMNRLTGAEVLLAADRGYLRAGTSPRG